MNLFKKKYQKSEWFEGLLDAEKLYHEGFEYHKNDGIHMWFRSKNLIDWHETLGAIPSYVAYKVSDPRCIGIADYLSYKEEYLK
jgi:hypothetical protein